jgi:hypothetical protein
MPALRSVAQDWLDWLGCLDSLLQQTNRDGVGAAS